MLVKASPNDKIEVQNIFNNTSEDKIIGFNKNNGTDFLLNSYPVTISFEGLLYPSVDHAYQASKTDDIKIRELIKKSKISEVKKLGRSLQIRDEWVKSRIDIMRMLIREKFQNPFLRHLLLCTGNLSLINDNLRNEKFWGMFKGNGENWLGKILEEVREEIKKEES